MAKPVILVVEDDLHLMEGIRDILELNGYEVLTATNGMMGLEVLRSQPRPPDLIVSDIMMPRMDGYDFFSAVQGVPSWLAIPFIFLTAKGERDDIHRGKRMGAEDYVTKPFDAEDLLIAVSSRLKRYQQRKDAFETEIATIKRNILTILNHEMRTPLTYVLAYTDLAYTDLMSKDPDTLQADEMRTFLRGINAGANRLRRLIENFILLVELETGEAQQNFDWRKQSFAGYLDLMNGIRAKYVDLALERGLRIEVDVPEGLPPVVGDREYLTAAVECLVDNAIKFSECPDCVITLRAYLDHNQLCLSVQDQGRGIPAHELEHIFQPLYQINRDKYEDQGAGSGLAIVDRVARLHSGCVTVESQVGEGSIFTLHLPLANHT